MRIFDWYYSDGDLPLTNKERREIRRSAWKLWMRDWRIKMLWWTSHLVWVLTMSIALTFGGVNFWQGLIIIMTCTGLLVICLQIVERAYIVPLGRRLIRQRGIDVCIGCGYWLRGLEKEVTECPECGWGREAEA